MTTTKTTNRFAFLGALLAAGLLLLAASASASADVSWSLTSEHGPQNLQPGGRGQYVLRPYNVGDANTSSEYRIEIELPSGVTASGFSGGEWSCVDLSASPIECTNSELVRRPGAGNLKNVNFRGNGTPLTLSVDVGPSASGTGDMVATISEGGEGPVGPVGVTDPTTFDAPNGFGFVPSTFLADLFDAAGPTGAGGTVGNPVRQAGAHPFEQRIEFASILDLANDPELGEYTTVAGSTKMLETRLPAGLIGNPQATPHCDAILQSYPGPGNKGFCPANTQVGSADLLLQDGVGVDFAFDVPVYNMVPPRGVVAAFGLSFIAKPVWILISLDPTDRYSVVATVKDTTEALIPRRVGLTLWGVPGDPAHNPLRMNPNGTGSNAMNTPFTAPIRPFLTLPSQCDTPAGSIKQRADSWQEPGVFTPWYEGPSIQATGCDDPRFRFEPSISIQPTSHEAAEPTGLDVDLSIPQRNDEVENAADLYAQNGQDVAINTPPVRTAVTQLPPGMAVNPSAADGLTGCSQAQVGLDDNDPVACPDNSKIGTVEIETPLMANPVHGFIYQAKQGDNPFGSTLAFYTVAEGEGLTIKLPAKVEADPQTGRLTTTFTDNPQLTFSHYRLHFWGGERAPLVNPPTCGSFEGTATVSSWNSSVPVAHIGDSAEITSGPGGAPCPSGAFAPRFRAGSTNPLAGAFSPFGLEVGRDDGTQGLSTIESTLPPGTLAKLAGVPYCSEAQIAAVSTVLGTGVGERANPSCPAASLVGHTDAGAGAGLPFHNPGNVYLAGPYKGAPLSLAIVTPVVGGPLDLGSVLTRVAMYVDPETAQVRAVSDPLPSMIAGIPLNLRSVRVSMDRTEFTLNPTSCEPTAVTGHVGGLAGGSADVSNRFQVNGCAALGFAPKLSMRLRGATGRAGHPSLRAVLTMPEGNANISRAAVTLPRSVLLDQGHIGTVCTRVQFAAEQCPAGSVYGYATAYSPLLDQPLQGPVYLRSSDHELPDLVASLDGQLEVDLAGRIDSVRGGIRTIFETVPDAAVSKFVLTMKGGAKGLLQNSRDLCAAPARAIAKFDAHNGRIRDFRPILRSSCGDGARKGKRQARRALHRNQTAR